MGKTLAKQRKKAQREALENQENNRNASSLLAIAKRLKFKLPAKTQKVKMVAFVSEALNKRAWEDALELFEVFHQLQEKGKESIPKLGAVMRWVRVADLAGSEAISAKLLAAIMRVAAGPAGPSSSSISADASSTAAISSGLAVRRLPPWSPPMPENPGNAATTAPSIPSLEEQPGPPEATATASSSDHPSTASPASTYPANAPPPARRYAGRFAVVPLPAEYAGINANASASGAAGAAAPPAAVAATTTLLPNLTKDLTMYCTEPGTVEFDPHHPPVTRVDVPFVPGAFALVNALSRRECEQIVACAEEMGYTVDPDYTFSAAARAAAAGGGMLGSGSGVSSAARNGGSGGGERGAAGCVWLADESLQNPIYDRVKHLLPQQLCGGALAGLNCRWRLYRYDKGSVYRPHVDGAWPGSGLRDGRYVFDAYGDRWSRLTFLVYLNDGFEGGNTTFYTPAAQDSGACLDAHSVKPRCGNILVFPHGDTLGSLVHEGAAVTCGSKYVIRTEVLYMVTHAGGRPQAAVQMPAQAPAAKLNK